MCSSSVHAPQCYLFWLQYLQFSLNIHSTELLKPCRKYVKDSSYHKIFYINYHQNKCMNSLNRLQETTYHFVRVKKTLTITENATKSQPELQTKQEAMSPTFSTSHISYYILNKADSLFYGFN